jgi:hypothetical protein
VQLNDTFTLTRIAPMRVFRSIRRIGTARIATAIALLALLLAPSYSTGIVAQETTGTIRGTVSGGQGTMVGTQVTALNTETGLSRSVLSVRHSIVAVRQLSGDGTATRLHA